MKCSICGAEIIEKNSHSGHPLVEGRVCPDCNWKVIRERLRKSREAEKAASESMAVIGCEGQVNVTDPIEDFEKLAKQFEETFILGNTPVRKEVAENKTKVTNGEVTGEVNSLEKPEKVEQVDPTEKKSATEAIYTYEEMNELFKLCKEIGIDTVGDLRKFLDENPGDTLEELRKYREELGSEFKIAAQG